jgi:hypothetical protein
MPKVKIYNLDGSVGITGRKAAKNLVRRNRATWCDTDERAIRIKPEYAERETIGGEALKLLIMATGYDYNVQNDECTANELKHIPFVGNRKLLLTGKSKRKAA